MLARWRAAGASLLVFGLGLSHAPRSCRAVNSLATSETPRQRPGTAPGTPTLRIQKRVCARAALLARVRLRRPRAAKAGSRSLCGALSAQRSWWTERFARPHRLAVTCSAATAHDVYRVSRLVTRPRRALGLSEALRPSDQSAPPERPKRSARPSARSQLAPTSAASHYEVYRVTP